MIFFVKNITNIMYVLNCIYLLLIIISSPFACGAKEEYGAGANSICSSDYNTTYIADDITSYPLINSTNMITHLFVVSPMIPTCCYAISTCKCDEQNMYPHNPKNKFSSRWNNFYKYLNKDHTFYWNNYRNKFSYIFKKFNNDHNKNSTHDITKQTPSLYSKTSPDKFLGIEYKWIECNNKNNNFRQLTITNPITPEKNNNKKSYCLNMNIGLWYFLGYLTWKSSYSMQAAFWVAVIFLNSFTTYQYNKTLSSILYISCLALFSTAYLNRLYRNPRPVYRLINVAIQITDKNNSPNLGISMQDYLQERLHGKITQLFSLLSISCLKNKQNVIFIKDLDDNIYAILRIYSSEETPTKNLKDMVPNKYKNLKSSVFIPLLNSNSTRDIFLKNEGFYSKCNTLMLFHSKELTH